MYLPINLITKNHENKYNICHHSNMFKNVLHFWWCDNNNVVIKCWMDPLKPGKIREDTAKIQLVLQRTVPASGIEGKYLIENIKWVEEN